MASYRKKKNSLISPYLVVVVTLALLGGFLYLKKESPIPISINEVSNATGLITLTLSPATQALTAGSNTFVDLNLSAGDSPALGVTAVLNYPEDKLEILSVEQGDFFDTVIQAPSWNSGKLTFTYIAPPTSGGKSGSGKVATINLKYKSGTPKLEFTTETLATAVGYEGNALKKATDAVITSQTVADPSLPPSTESSVQPSVAPSPAEEVQAPSQTTLLKLDGATACNQATLKWEKISGADGYYLDISKNSLFSKIETSGKLSSGTDRYSFSSLDKDTTYYARIALASSHDFPHYSPVFEFQTAKECLVVTPAPSPTASPVSTPTPSPTVAPKKSLVTQTVNKLFNKAAPSPTTSPVSTPTPTPTSDNSAFEGSLNDVFVSPAPQEAPVKRSFFTEFFAWLTSLFKFN